MDCQLRDKSLTELARLLKRGDISAEEITLSCLARIETVESTVNAFTEIFYESAVKEARSADRKRCRGEILPAVAGLPVGIKDNINLAGRATTCCSRVLEGYISPYDATVISDLRRAGAVFLGKLNMDEFAMGSSTETSCFGPVHNPWNEACVPGGSSGGSAAAVAAGEVVWALGSDTGGSIRQPAAFCGLVGFKPTYGSVSRYGLVAFASSLDQIGPITKSVQDAMQVFLAIARRDPRDSTSVEPACLDVEKLCSMDCSGLKIGIIKELAGERIDHDVKDRFEDAVAVLEAAGAQCREVSMPVFEFALPAYYVVAAAEASSNLARFDGVRYGRRSIVDDPIEMYKNTREAGFGPEVKRRIMLGTYVLSSGYYEYWYQRAQKARTVIRESFREVFDSFHCLISPTAPTVA
ncbi:MAG: Asp-tRNA(Asn)/Glu-tRNA(Gln) amidotransferase subunit GatA, partial [bacterium]|nr:Asp-tRNA(Asn)/Glu-tRNA(Gln) amidotransferase subunit GatA [bacterium]